MIFWIFSSAGVKIHIQRWGGQPNPNRIMTPTAVISVRGTIFDVSINDDDETTIVSVEEGSVEVRHALKPGAAKIVNAGESLHVYKDEPLAKSAIDKNELAHRIVRAFGRRRLSASPSVPRGALARLPVPPPVDRRTCASAAAFHAASAWHSFGPSTPPPG